MGGIADVAYAFVSDMMWYLCSITFQAGMLREDGRFEGERAAFCVNAKGAIMAGFVGNVSRNDDYGKREM